MICFSDPHSDIQKKRGYPDFLEQLVSQISEMDFDVMLVTGDIAGSTNDIQEFLQAFQSINQTKLFVPGNHDVWVNKNFIDGSWSKYYEVLPELCRQYGWHYLPKNPTIIQNIAFVGTIGWYNYSTRNTKWDTKFTFDDYKMKIHPHRRSVWMDREFIRFGCEDQVVAEHFNADLIQDISKILKKPTLTGFKKIDKYNRNASYNVKNSVMPSKLVVGTHIVPFVEMVHFTGKTDWDFFSAFIGNKDLGDLLTQISNLINVISISGHTHFPQRFYKPGLDAYCVPLGYPHEWMKKYDSLESMLKSRIVKIFL